MAFQKAAGYNNLPNGVFSPVIYSARVQKAFRKSSVVQDITNTDYFGEISNFGDSVKIIKEPEISIRPYARGTQVTPQDLEDSDFTLLVDRANYFSFKIDDIEEAHSHVNFESLATDRAGYKLKDGFDRDVLSYMAGYEYNGNTGLWTARTSAVGTKANDAAGDDELLAANKLTRGDFGATVNPTFSISVGLEGTRGTDYDATPLGVMNRMSRLLTQNNVDMDNRFFVADPVFFEMLADEDSKLLSSDYSDQTNIIRNGRITSGQIRGFQVYQSMNLPSFGTGPGTNDADGSDTNYGVLIAGHRSAIATAEQINKTESFRDPDSFADIVRGMHLYGRKILRPESLVIAIYNIQ